MSAISQSSGNLQVLRNPAESIENGVFFTKKYDYPSIFEQRYLQLRTREHRIYSDAQLKELPHAFAYNVHKQEWDLRAKSQRKIQQYLKRKQNVEHILEIGCGNGWLSDKLARSTEAEVFAFDTCLQEMKQGAQVFQRPNLHFVYGDIFEEIFEENAFDVILMADTIQYFPDVFKIVDLSLSLLKEGGELHIFDSPLYKASDVQQAELDSLTYLEELGVGELIDLAHHHCLDDFLAFPHEYLYKPGRWKQLVGKKDSPFPWIRMVKGI